jgi:hypothetical protein
VVGWEIGNHKDWIKMGKNYSGMTVNERLYESRQIKAWDTATLKRDVNKMKEILSSIDLGDQAEEIIASQFKLLGYKDS